MLSQKQKNYIFFHTLWINKSKSVLRSTVLLLLQLRCPVSFWDKADLIGTEWCKNDLNIGLHICQRLDLCTVSRLRSYRKANFKLFLPHTFATDRSVTEIMKHIHKFYLRLPATSSLLQPSALLELIEGYLRVQRRGRERTSGVTPDHLCSTFSGWSRRKQGRNIFMYARE